MSRILKHGEWMNSPYRAEWLVCEYAPNGCWEVISTPIWGDDNDWDDSLFRHLNPELFSKEDTDWEISDEVMFEYIDTLKAE